MYEILFGIVCIVILSWSFIASLVFLRSSQIRPKWCPSDVPVDDQRLLKLMKWSHYWRIAYLSCLLFESIWLVISIQKLKLKDYSIQCTSIRVSAIVFALINVIKFVFEYFRCEALFGIVSPGEKFKILRKLVLRYGVIANLSFITMMIVLHFRINCNIFISGETLWAQRALYLTAAYILINEFSTIFLFLYPLWFLYQDGRKGFLKRYKDLNRIRNLAYRTVLLSIPTLFIQATIIIMGGIHSDWLRSYRDWPILVYLYACLIQYISMCLKYNYWTYLFWPWVIPKKSVPEGLGYELMPPEETETSVCSELTIISNMDSSNAVEKRFSWAFETAQIKLNPTTDCLTAIRNDQHLGNYPISLPLRDESKDLMLSPVSFSKDILIASPQVSFSRCATVNSESDALTPCISIPQELRGNEKSGERTEPCLTHKRSSEYMRKLIISESNHPISSSMAMNDEQRIQWLTYAPERDEYTKGRVELRGVTLKWFINWARLNMKLLMDLNGLRKVSTRDLVQRVVEIRTKKSMTKPLWLQIPVEEIGTPHIFVSHAWDMEVQELIEALREWRREQFNRRWGKCPCLPKKMKHSMEPFIWLDIFALPQPGIDAAVVQNTDDKKVEEALCTTIQTIGEVVLCSDLNFKPLKRSWCLYELAMAHQLGVTYHLATSGEFDRVCQSEARARAKIVDVANAKSGNPNDKRMIDQLILQEFGDFEKLNTIIWDIFEPKINDWKAGIAGIWTLPKNNNLTFKRVGSIN